MRPEVAGCIHSVHGGKATEARLRSESPRPAAAVAVRRPRRRRFPSSHARLTSARRGVPARERAEEDVGGEIPRQRAREKPGRVARCCGSRCYGAPVGPSRDRAEEERWAPEPRRAMSPLTSVARTRDNRAGARRSATGSTGQPRGRLPASARRFSVPRARLTSARRGGSRPFLVYRYSVHEGRGAAEGLCPSSTNAVTSRSATAE